MSKKSNDRKDKIKRKNQERAAGALAGLSLAATEGRPQRFVKKITGSLSGRANKQAQDPTNFDALRAKIKAHGKHSVFTADELKKKSRNLYEALSGFGPFYLSGAQTSASDRKIFKDKLGTDSFIYMDKNKSPTVILHELGHATGAGRKFRDRFKVLNTLTKKHRYYAPYVSMGQFLNTGLAKDEKALDHASKLNKAKLLISAGLELPELIEEGRANIRAVGLGKKLGVPANKKLLAASFGTYLGSSLGRTAIPYYTNKMLIKYRRDRMRKLKERGSDK